MENKFNDYLLRAKILDSNDSLATLRDRFYFLESNTEKSLIYLCGNSLGLQPITASKYINEELEAWRKYGVEGHFNAKRPWMQYHEFLIKYSIDLRLANLSSTG